jgi:lysozyme
MINPREIKLLQVQEGLRLLRYLDSNGFWTLGYGHNIEAHNQMHITTCTLEQAQAWLMDDIADVRGQLIQRVPCFPGLSDVRQAVLVSMGFMGVNKFMEFVKFLHAVSVGDWQAARSEILNSEYAHEVKARAVTLSNMMVLDVWPEFTNP